MTTTLRRRRSPTVRRAGRIRGLQCRECGELYPTEARHVCDMCFGPLEVAYDYDVDPRQRHAREHRRRPALALALPGPAADRG